MNFIELTVYEKASTRSGYDNYNCVGVVPVNVAIIGEISVFHHGWGSDMTLIRHAYTNAKLIYAKETPQEIMEKIASKSRLDELESRITKIEDKIFKSNN